MSPCAGVAVDGSAPCSPLAEHSTRRRQPVSPSPAHSRPNLSIPADRHRQQKQAGAAHAMLAGAPPILSSYHTKVVTMLDCASSSTASGRLPLHPPRSCLHIRPQQRSLPGHHSLLLLPPTLSSPLPPRMLSPTRPASAFATFCSSAADDPAPTSVFRHALERLAPRWPHRLARQRRARKQVSEK